MSSVLPQMLVKLPTLSTHANQPSAGADAEVAATNLRVRNALDKASTNIMLADNDGQIVYQNEAVRHAAAPRATYRKELARLV